MYRSFGFLLLLLSIIWTLPVQAQNPRHHRMMQSDSMSVQAMMQQRMAMMQNMPMMRGMHQQMMQSPLHRAGMMVFMLPSMADTLGLSDEQVSQLKQRKSQLLEQQTTHRQEMMNARQDLQAMFDDNAQPAPSDVRERLQTMSDLRTGWQATVYETAYTMRETLTDEQRDMLDSMTPQQHMHQVMSQMSMQDAMTMMQTLHGGSLMNGMGAMNGMGMMRGNMNQMPMMRQNQNR